MSQAADTLHLYLHFAQLAEFHAEFLFFSTAIHNYSQTASDRLVCLGVTGYLPILHKNDHLCKATSQQHFNPSCIAIYVKQSATRTCQHCIVFVFTFSTFTEGFLHHFGICYGLLHSFTILHNYVQLATCTQCTGQ